MDAIEAIGTARATRWFRPDPLPDDIVERIVWAGARASSAHNCQPWDFVVITRPDLRASMGEAIRTSVARRDPMPVASSRGDEVIEAGVRNLFANIDQAPVIVLICAENDYPHGNPIDKFMWSAVASAAQNMIVAARSLGVGMANTMLHTLAEPEIRELLKIPDNRVLGVTAVLGWPDRAFGPINRKPMDEMVHRDGW